jgi:serine/threonine protein kinase
MDIKPDNVIIDNVYLPSFIDWDMSLMIERAIDIVLGTPAYYPPEMYLLH